MSNIFNTSMDNLLEQANIRARKISVKDSLTADTLNNWVTLRAIELQDTKNSFLDNEMPNTTLENLINEIILKQAIITAFQTGYLYYQLENKISENEIKGIQ